VRVCATASVTRTCMWYDVDRVARDLERTRVERPRMCHSRCHCVCAPRSCDTVEISMPLAVRPARVSSFAAVSIR
jgi:hypothetical protein